MLIFQWFANSRIVREFPPFSFKVRIATLTRNQFEGNLTWVRIPLAAPNKNVFHPRMEHVFFVSQASAQNATCLNSATQHRMMARGT